jgi:hypothetical protein
MSGTATYTPTGGGTPTEVGFDIDLLKTAADVAALVQETTGIEISTDAPPSDSSAARGINAKTAGAAVGVKSHAVVILLMPVFVAITGFAMVLAMSQIAHAFVLAEQVFMVAFLTPFIVMGELMRTAISLPLVPIAYGSVDVHITIPRPS